MTRYLPVFITLVLLAAPPVRADIAIIINSDSPVRSLSRDDAINIFMGRFRRLPDGSVALPIDQTPLRARFYKVLVNKEIAEINSWWARLVFSGRASPPQQVANHDELLDIVMHNANALGYVDAASIDAAKVDAASTSTHMRVLLTLDE